MSSNKALNIDEYHFSNESIFVQNILKLNYTFLHTFTYLTNTKLRDIQELYVFFIKP